MAVPFFFLPPSPFPRSRAHVFACFSLTRHPYNVRAWNRLGRWKKIRAVFIKLLNHKKISYTYSRTQSFIVFYWNTLASQLSCPSCLFIVPRYPRFQVSLFSDHSFLIFHHATVHFRALQGKGFTPTASWCKRQVDFDYKEHYNKQDGKWGDAKR